MNQRGSALVILFFMGILLLSMIIVSGGLYIKNNHPEWIGNSNSSSDLAISKSNISDTINNTLAESTPCIKFKHTSDFKLNPKSVIKTTNSIREGSSEYGSTLLLLDKQIVGSEAYGIIIFCGPSNWTNSQRYLSESNLDALKTRLNKDVQSGKDPVDDQVTVKYDLTMSQIGNIQNSNNLTATKIIEVYYTNEDSLWSMKEHIYIQSNNYFYMFTNTGSSHDEESIKTEIKQFEDLFQNATLINPISD